MFLLALAAPAPAQIQIKIPNPLGRTRPSKGQPPAQPSNRPGAVTMPTGPAAPGAGGSIRPAGDDTSAKQANQQRFNEMNKEVPELFQAVEYFHPVYADPKASYVGNHHGAERSLATLAKLDELCKTKYAGVKDFGSPWGWEQSPETWCDIAAKRDELHGRHKANVLNNDTDLKGELENVDEAMKRLLTGDGFIRDGTLQAILEREQYKREHYATKRFAKAGVPMPAGFFAPLDAKLDELAAAAEKRAATSAFPAARFHDAAIEQFARVKFKQLHNKTVLKIHMTDTDWRAYRNSIGIPTERYRGGLVLLKPAGPAGAKWCQHRTFHIKELWVGGRWGSRTLDYSGSAALLKCQ